MKLKQLYSFLVLLLLTACGTFQVGVESNATGTEASFPIETAVPQASAILPSSTVPVPPTVESTSSPVPTSGPTLPPVASETLLKLTPTPQRVEIFLIALEDNGQTGQQVGCGDSLVPVQVQIAPTQGVLKAALEKLFSLKERFYGQSGLYNALYQSDLQIERLSIDAQGMAQIYLTGTLTLGGECDDPRVQAQITQTALQFSTVKEVSVFLNGQSLKEALSLK